MLAPKTVKNYTNSGESLRELKFITELGRSLLGTVHPKRVALRVAENLRFETGADICAVVAELEQIGLTSAAFDKLNNQIEGFLNRQKFEQRTRDFAFAGFIRKYKG